MEGNLENKLRRWHTSHSSSISTIVPRNSSEGYIEIKDENKVITLKNNFTGKVGLEPKQTPLPTTQIWKLGKEDGKGWRTIQHSETGLYLTTKYENKVASLVVNDKGMLNI